MQHVLHAPRALLPHQLPSDALGCISPHLQHSFVEGRGVKEHDTPSLKIQITGICKLQIWDVTVL